MSERITYFVQVILPVPIHKEFTYRVPNELAEQIDIGKRVVVPFGKSKLITGIISKITDLAPTDHQAKYVEHLLDDTPIITGNQFKFWRWISSYYMAPIGDVMNAALPSNFKLASETKLALHPDYDEKQPLSERHALIVDALEANETMDLKQLADLVKIKSIQPIIKQLIDKRIIVTLESLQEKYNPKTAHFLSLKEPNNNPDVLHDTLIRLEQKKSSEKQYQALLKFLQLRDEHQEEFIAQRKLIDMEVSTSTLTTLIKNGILQKERFQISRFEEKTTNQKLIQPLSNAQQAAYDAIKMSFETHVTTLLFGVTGSGKTELYVQLIQEQLDLGKQILFLLPEIALTTQLIQRLSAYFGEQVGVYHSKFNQNERVEIWNHVLANDPNKFRIILGARSSLFLPFQDLGLIIVDEEHESSFKQHDPSPRYHARDAAIVLGHLHHAKVLLGSATPSIESFFNAKSGKYGFVTLSERFGGLQLPEILCADLKKERRQKSMQSDFSSFLIDEMREALNRKEQIILFQNRRGYTPLWSCEICNWTPTCKHCDVSLTYHKQTNSLKCHYCGYVTAPMGSCSCCGSNRIKMLGFGTEKIEDDLALIFPNAKIQRLDLDSTRAKNAYETILHDFEKRNTDILIGTQMVSKGLDFDHVSLVGILDADMMLNRADFRAFERSFQLMSQVGGRSGRKNKRGKVIIQTGNPDHWVIEKVHEHDYLGFYEHEIIERNNYFYPPYFKLIEFTLKHKEEYILSRSALELANLLRELFKERVIGPEFPVIKRVQNLYIKQIKLKIERDASDKIIKEHIKRVVDQFFSVPSNKSVRLAIDVDPA